MAYLKPVLPQVVGQPRSARRDARAIFVPNAWGSVGEGIQGLNRGALVFGGALVALERDRQEADFRRVLNKGIAEVNDRLNNEVYNRSGFDAEGSVERTKVIYQEALDKAMPMVKGAYSRRLLTEAMGTKANATVSHVMGWERDQLRSASLAADKNVIRNSTDQYALTGDDSLLGMAREAYDDVERQVYGNVVTPDTVARWEQDLADGNGKVTLPDGRTLNIVSDEMGPGPGTLTHSQVAGITDTLKKRAASYQSGLTNYYDQAHAKRVDGFIAAGRTAEAEAYLNMVEKGAYAPSAGALKIMRGAVAAKQAAVQRSLDVNKYVDDILARNANDARYGSDLIDRDFSTIRGVLERQLADDPEERKRVLQLYDIRVKEVQNRQKAELAGGIEEKVVDFHRRGLSLQQQLEQVQGMPDSPVKDALLKQVQGNIDAEEKRIAEEERARNKAQAELERTPEFQRDQEKKLVAFLEALDRGSYVLETGDSAAVIRWDDPKLSAQEVDRKILTVINDMGLSQPYQQKAIKAWTDRDKIIHPNVVARKIEAMLNKPAGYGEAYLQTFPWVLNDLNSMKGDAVLKDTQLDQFLQQALPRLLTMQVYRDQWGIDPRVETTEMVGSQREHYMTEEALIAAWKQREGGRYGVMPGRFIPNPNQKQWKDFLRQRGMEKRGKYYYFTGEADAGAY